MNESLRIADQLHRSYFGQAWHGPSLKEALEGVDAEKAAAHPIPSAHSIWEIVLHVDAWVREATETIGGKPYETLQGERDWPPVRSTSADAWRETVDALQKRCESLVAAIQAFPPDKLGDGDRSYYALLHGIIQHNAYHGGQIALMKKF